MGKNKQNQDKRPHFVKTIDYHEEPWLTDIIFGQRGSNSHAHIVASGAMILYLRDEEGKEIINENK
jgi:hypothetical protein